MVLDNMNLTIRDGETIVIIGRSGIGKSVTLKHIIGLMKPDSGQVIVDGLDITRLDAKGLNELNSKIFFRFD